MSDPTSAIADFYPAEFAVDGEGKRTDWEAVILLPFIDFDRLLQAYNSCEPMLTPEDHRRNSTGKMYLFKYQKGSHETSFCTSTLPTVLPGVSVSNSTVHELSPKKALPASAPGFQPALTQVNSCSASAVLCLSACVLRSV
jgi:5'-3' exonuclease